MKIRQFFPQALNTNQVYLDSAATTLKLKPAIDRVVKFYTQETANVHRGRHTLSERATSAYEQARETTAQFLSAESSDEIVFTKSVTDGINFLSQALTQSLNEGDEILITQMEHHSNYLPWISTAKKKNLKIKIAPVRPDGSLDLNKLFDLLTPSVKVFSFVHQSNVLGSVNPAQKLIEKARANQTLSIIDAAQSVSTMDLNVQQLDCDFLVFSGHKLFSPSGAGVIYGKKSLWKNLEPVQTGGGMVVDSLKELWSDPPHRFEAGTPPIEGVLALAESINFLKNNTDFNEIKTHEKNLLDKAEEVLQKIPGLKILGQNDPTRINTLSFIVEGFHSEDIAQIIAVQKVAVRAGHHCCQPLLDQMNLDSGTVRASFSVYNEEEEVNKLEKSIKKAIEVLK